MRKIEGGKPYLLDTSAIITLWTNEKGADEVEAVLRSRENREYRVK
jgi:PIN domain nuclease of toxin-antitoxin system